MDELIDWASANLKRKLIVFLGSAILCSLILPEGIRGWHESGSTGFIKLAGGLIALATYFAFSILGSLLPKNWDVRFGHPSIGILLLGSCALLATLAIAYIFFCLYGIWAFSASVDPAHRYAPFWLSVPLMIGAVALAGWAWWSYGRRS